MAAVDGKLYVTGGYDRGSTSKTGEVLDLATMRWSALPEMATPRGYHGRVPPPFPPPALFSPSRSLRARR